MRQALSLSFILALELHPKAMADALSYNEPRKDQFRVLMTAITKIEALSDSPLHSYLSKDESTSYYLRDASFLGRTTTVKGYMNLVRVTFIRSSPYLEERSLTSPPRGHSFVVFLDDELDPKYFLSIPMPDSAILDRKILSVDESKYVLTLDASFQLLTPIKTEQADAAHPAKPGG